MIDGFPLAFFLPLVVHALAGLTTGVTGVITFSRPKRRGRHPKWGVRYLWAYTVVFLTATILSVQHWPADAYLFILATLGYGFALSGYAARRFRQEPMVRRFVGKQWVVAHIVGMIGSYTVLWTAFFVDNAHLQILEITAAIAWENFHARVNHALDLEAEGVAGRVCLVPQEEHPPQSASDEV